MNESILNALLQLFAMIANVGKYGLSSRATEIVHSFLQQHLSIQLINKYLTLFEKYIVAYHPQQLTDHGKSSAEPYILDHETILSICSQINRNLRQREKFIVFMRLVEFINEDEVLTQRELDFVKKVAGCFNLSDTEHDNTRAFVLDSFSVDIQKDKLLTVSQNDKPDVEGIRHLRKKDFDGTIVVLHHESTNTFIFRYFGKSNLYLNGHYIPPGRIHLLEQGSLITSPKIKPVYYSDVVNRFFHEEDRAKVVLVACDIEFRFKKSENGIRRFSFTGESGSLIGILGGSGVGKSTLLSILNGNSEPQGGQVLINGHDLYKEKEKLEGVIGFIPQDDLLMEELTVFQNLYFNAKLCFSNSTEEQILARILRILSDLELSDIQDLKVGNPLHKFISGGQRKRLNIALELIREPYILYVDEPTSGLSSLDAEKVMLLLKEQTLQGKLVIVNIHQPYSDIFKLFDRILILDKGGYPIYQGNPIDALTYFKSASNYVNAEEGQCLSCGNVIPEEILQIVEAREVDEYGKLVDKRKVLPQEWYHLYQENFRSDSGPELVHIPLPERIFRIPNPWSQFRIFSIRNILSKLANRQYMLINFLEAPLLALIIGYFTRYVSDISGNVSYIFRENENLPAYIFMAVVVALFMGLTVSAEEIIRDRKILKRESFLHLSRLSYLHSKMLILFLISAIQTFTFVIIGNTILEIKGMTMAYWLILFSASCMANLVGLNLSAALNSVVAIYIVIPFVIVPQLLFSGVIVPFDKLHKVFRDPVFVPAIGEMMTSRWAYEALAVHQFKSNRYERNFFKENKEEKNAGFYAGSLIPQLILRLDEADRNIRNRLDMEDQTAHALDLVRNEMHKLHRFEAFPAFPETGRLTPHSFDSAIHEKARNYLLTIQAYYRKKQAEAVRKRDARIKELVSQYGSKEGLVSMQQDYTNNKLTEQLTNRHLLKIFNEVSDELIRKKELVYMDPLSRTGRAHFYAAVKIIGNYTLDTFWFNTLVIWFSTLLLYLALVYDLLRKILMGFENWKLRRRE